MLTNPLIGIRNTIVTVLLTNLPLVAVAWVAGWPSIDGVTLFLLGLATMVVAYLLDASLSGKYKFKENEGYGAIDQIWKYRWRKYIYSDRSSLRREAKTDQLKADGDAPADLELEKARRLSGLLMNISFAGAIAAILSFILPRLF